MIARSLLAAVVIVAFATPASAFYCPKQGKAVTAALASSSLSAAKKAEVEKLRDQGMAAHGGGDHTAAVKALAAATRILLGNGM
ncbi:MAG: hypothetical protein V3S95_05715 [Alphaproteobacteria bacterium]